MPLEVQFPKEVHEDTLEVLGKLALYRIVAGVVTSTNTEYPVKDWEVAAVPSDAFLFVQVQL